MPTRCPCPPAPGLLEGYATAFDEVAQRRAFRAHLEDLLLPHDRPKTLTGPAGGEPTVPAHAAKVPYVLVPRPSKSIWGLFDAAHSPEESAQRL